MDISLHCLVPIAIGTDGKEFKSEQARRPANTFLNSKLRVKAEEGEYSILSTRLIGNSKTMRKFYLIIACTCIGWTVKAQDSLKTVSLDEVVVTGTKSAIPIEKSGKSIFKLSREEIEANSGKSVEDILNEVPGIQIDGNFGPAGTNISYFVRGASSKRTLILIDGVPFNDPSGINQTYDLRLLDLDQIESIEVLKGGLSTLYGTGAAAGVINITTKKPNGESFQGSASIDYGSFNTLKPSLNLSGANDALSYSFSGGYQQSDGFSAAEDQTGNGGFDEDGFKSYNLLGKMGYDFSDAFSLQLTTALDDFNTDFDGGAFFDGDNTSEYSQWRIGLTPTYKWTGGNLTANLFYSKLDRLFNSPDFADPTQRFINEYDAKTTQADFILDQNLSSTIKLIGGINYQNSAFSQPLVPETNFSIVDPYVSFIYDQSNLNLQVGARVNNHNEYGSQAVYNLNPSYLININEGTDLKVFSSYSTSFITPSLFQLYGSFGNLALQPEESQTFDLGTSWYGESLTVDVAYFYRKDEDLIDFRSLFDDGGNFIGGEYFNTTNNIEVDGIEVSARYSINSTIQLSSNYSYLKPMSDAVLFRVPKYKYGFSLSTQPVDGLNVVLKHNHTGSRVQPVFNNVTFETDNVTTSAFDLVDLFASYRFNQIEVSGAINNIFDEKYVAIVGFNTIGRNYSLGVKMDF